MDDIKDWFGLLGTGGGLGAFTLLVRMFLNRQHESEALFRADLKDTRDQFSGGLEKTHVAFTDQLRKVTAQFAEQHEAQIKVNVETVNAINGLRDDVQDLKNKVHS